MRIDVHSHYWPASYIDLLVELGREDLRFAGRQVDDLDDRLAEMDQLDVDVSVLSAVGLSVEVGDPAGATRGARHINDVYAGIMDRYPGRFQSFGTVPLPFVDEAIAETDRCLDELGFAGICLACSYDGKPIDHPDFEAFWANLARHDAVVYVHPVGTNSACHPGLDSYGLHTAYGSPMQIAIAPVRLVYSGISTRYPNLKFIFALCGGFLPYFWPRQERNLRRALDASATAAVGNHFFAWVKDLPLDHDDPMSALKRFWYDTSTQDLPMALLCAKQSYGADRLLLGSDAIFASLTEAISYIEESEHLTAEEKDRILNHAAQEVLHLPERARR
jgi:predicted TIM-barrel fold metal-dependent hydrolase